MGITNKKNIQYSLDIFLLVVLKSEISKNFDGIVREIERWVEILG